jgi:hypothetical protein
VLETWEAKRLERIISSGRTRPLVIECSRSSDEIEDDSGVSSEDSLKVVKAFDLPEISDFSLFSELFGNSLARVLGLETPEPCLVHISGPFANSANVILGREGLTLKAGLASGCQYFSGGYRNVIPETLSVDELQEAAQIYAFDLLVQNPDRVKQRPNCAMSSAGITTYDFETAFSFVFVIGKQALPYEVSKHNLAKNHLFYPALRARKKELDWKPFVSRLRKVTQIELERMTAGFPPAWLAHFPEVSAHILTTVEHARDFELELRRSLI